MVHFRGDGAPMVTRMSGTDALSLHTQSSKTPAHTITFVIIDASDQLGHEKLHQLVAAAGALSQPTGGQAAGGGPASVE